MDFPLFHLDFMNNRMLIAVIAILHVIINHGLAVGLIPLVTLLEFRGYKAGRLGYTTGSQWDSLAYKIMFTGFVITTSIGAMTGVGIWFAASLTNPAAIGSLTRVFYGAWFTEWIIFMLEVVFIMIYFLTWKKANRTQQSKKQHIIAGALLSLFSWLTMAIIVAILGFMMDPGNWLSEKSFLTGMLNPIYLPQLLFRTPLAMIIAGAFVLLLTVLFIDRQNTIKHKAIRFASFWILLWTPVMLLGAYLYYYQIPGFMIGNLPVATGTQAFQQWYQTLTRIILISVSIALVVSIIGISAPKYMRKTIALVPIIVFIMFLGYFERLREFIRKPYIIGNYMYANAITTDDYALYTTDGILKHATYASQGTITLENKTDAGRDVFRIACTRCHTTFGLNSIVKKFENMYGAQKPFNKEAMKAYIKNMHNVKIYMPPFPGNESELDALASYIAHLQEQPERLEGAQSSGITVNPANQK